MAKGKPASKITKGAKGRKNHGPKRHLHHNIEPKATRMAFARAGVLSKYDDYESFYLSLQARGVRTNTQSLWYEFCGLTKKNEEGELVADRAAQKAFLADIKNVAARLAAANDKKAKAAKKEAK